MVTRRLLDLIETNMVRRPPNFEAETGTAVGDGFHVVVVGGGLAGSVFARQFLRRTAQIGVKARITLINAVNCNYCGGLITGLASETLRSLCGLDLPPERVLSTIRRCYYVNPFGSGEFFLGLPQHSVLRTGRFGEPGFDESLKNRITDGLSPDTRSRLTVIEPARALEILPPGRDGTPATVRYMRHARNGKPLTEEVRGDFLVMATGLRSQGMKVMDSFSSASGYRFPPTMEASVTEIDLSGARRNLLGDALAMVNGVLPGCVIALIPKRRDWLTLTSVGRCLTSDDVDRLFAHPAVCQVIDVPGGLARLRCGQICRARVSLGPSKHYWGRGWLAVGDLTGCGRIFKDGCFAAWYGADLAARTIVHRGVTDEAIGRYYSRPLTSWSSDESLAGLALFRMSLAFGSGAWTGRLIVGAVRSERDLGLLGGPVHSAFRAVTSGELNYRWIGGLLAWGLLRHAARFFVNPQAEG